IISSNDYQNINGYWLKKHTFSKWTTKGYTRNLSTDFTIPLIRLAEVYMIQAEAWNEYLDKPDNRVYNPLDKVRERAGIPNVVSSWKSYSKTPNKVDTKEGMREIIRQENSIEFAFEGHRYWNLRRWKIAHELLNEKQYGWNVLGETARTFYNNFNGPVVVWSKCKFTAPRDYLDPIDAEEILISSMVQNPGW
ncbi:RagB/SusD family nutrient uptake outer membrane protein, partial [Butyricimonas paravirosa]